MLSTTTTLLSQRVEPLAIVVKDYPETPHRTRNNSHFPPPLRYSLARLRLVCPPIVRRNGASHERVAGGEGGPIFGADELRDLGGRSIWGDWLSGTGWPGHAVADATFGTDVGRIVGVISELAAEVPDQGSQGNLGRGGARVCPKSVAEGIERSIPVPR